MEELQQKRVDLNQRIVDMAVDLAREGAPEAVIERAVTELGHVDVLVCNHARSGGDGAIGYLNAEMLDAHWAVNHAVLAPARAGLRCPA